ncbi:hypothetical protein [Goekera deserti]|uniref:Uncharacterized protein n=1 Tax=Goekera deserti TaxID=2497753 RepID=A0A7K3WC26_9ACTN|nr:hypothetical protein [Goekera deserti]NEL54025.1 hypothetical protein [Goekera deserti]
MPPGFARTVLLTPVVGLALLLALAVVDRPAFYWALREDRLVEWGQFALCLVTAPVAVAAATLFVLRREPLLAALAAATGLGSFLLAGEEISWGQRVFAFSTPDELAGANQQAEFNLHNVDAGLELQDLFKLVEVALGVTGIVLALLVWGGRLTHPFWTAVAPPRYTVPAFAMMVVYTPMLFLPLDAAPLIVLQEWAELCLFLGLAMTVCCVLVRAAGGAPGVSSAPVHRGRHAAVSPGRPLLSRPWAVPATAVVAVLALTVVFATLTAVHGIVPGDVVQ